MSFQGVVCRRLGAALSLQNLLDLKHSCRHHGLSCYELELKNKYYHTKIHLFDYHDLTDDQRDDLLKECHAVILYGKGLSDTLLEENVEFLHQVGGEPRLLVCDQNESLREWSLKNNFDLLDAADEDIRSQMIDSLSAYKWPLRTDRDEQQSQLEEETIKRLTDFDYLLNRVKTCRDDPDDRKINEIGQLLSNLLGDDVD